MSKSNCPPQNDIIISARGLCRYFESGTEQLKIIDKLDVDIIGGEALAIVGASGSGKSTLLYALGGLDHPNAGEVLYSGRNIFDQNETELAAWRNKIVGFVFQFHHLLSDFTALENVAMPAMLSGMKKNEALERARPLLARVGLSERLDHKPGAMSGGEQQRAALARALIMEPKLLLADEPTGNLDLKNSSTVNELIMELVLENKLAAVIVTHNSQLASLAHRAMELREGRLLQLAD